ncbi:MAG: hypothetical protein JW779_01385 [Candidatus Thorarchaeota archaeon]|nr:hypothetical protein [Candidatus Thorarchaeota archaeon]
MWREEIQPEIAATEEPMLQMSFKVGIFGAVLVFINTTLSNSIYISFMLALIDYSTYIELHILLTYFFFTSVIFVNIGFFALLRKYGSKLALPYVFISLSSYAFNVSLLYPFLPSIIYQFVSYAIGITRTLILVWILLSIVRLVESSLKLKYYILIVLLSMFLGIFTNIVIVSLLPLEGFILSRVLNVILSLVESVLLVAIFYKEQVRFVIEDGIQKTQSQEWL